MLKKKCSKCLIYKKIDSFYKRIEGKGVFSQCDECSKLYQRRYNNDKYAKNPEYRKERLDWIKSERGKESNKIASKKASLKYKVRWIARAKARYAVSKGMLFKPKKCEVCELVKPLQGHHEDYSKPLEVIWLCARCHGMIDRIDNNK